MRCDGQAAESGCATCLIALQRGPCSAAGAQAWLVRRAVGRHGGTASSAVKRGATALQGALPAGQPGPPRKRGGRARDPAGTRSAMPLVLPAAGRSRCPLLLAACGTPSSRHNGSCSPGARSREAALGALVDGAPAGAAASCCHQPPRVHRPAHRKPPLVRFGRDGAWPFSPLAVPLAWPLSCEFVEMAADGGPKPSGSSPDACWGMKRQVRCSCHQVGPG